MQRSEMDDADGSDRTEEANIQDNEASGRGSPDKSERAVAQVSEAFFDALADRLSTSLLKVMLPRIEAAIKVQPRWLSIESAGAYIDKTYEGMRYTIGQYPQELPVVMIGDKPRIDIKDIDRFMMNRKSK